MQSKLNNAKKRHIDSQREIDTIKQRIADLLCPLKIGDQIHIVDDRKSFTGKVEQIAYCSEPRELLGSILGVKDGWSASGHRIKSTTQEVGKWSFPINSFDYQIIDKTWTGRTKSIEEVFNIKIINKKIA